MKRDGIERQAAGQFCWVDLAASDAGRAKAFYERLFGWTSREHTYAGGVYTRFHHLGRDIASFYQLDRANLERGVPSHWTAYVQVRDVDESAARAALLGGSVVVDPFTIEGVARIALVRDCVGAFMGLWQTQAQPSHTHKETA